MQGQGILALHLHMMQGTRQQAQGGLIMAKVTVNIEEMEIGLRQSLFGFTIGKGVHVSIWASDQGEAIKRFREMTEEDVVFITDAEMERRKAAA